MDSRIYLDRWVIRYVSPRQITIVIVYIYVMNTEMFFITTHTSKYTNTIDRIYVVGLGRVHTHEMSKLRHVE